MGIRRCPTRQSSGPAQKAAQADHLYVIRRITIANGVSSVNIDEETFLLLGLALYAAQKFEFGLYGIASHMSHLPEAKKDRRFANLTPDVFLSVDPKDKEKRKATLGQICELFGDRLLLASDELEGFVVKRNLIAHDFWRAVRPLRGYTEIPNPNEFLREFIRAAQKQTSVMQGLLSHLMEAAAQKEGRSDEFSLSEGDIENRRVFEAVVAKRL